MRASPRYLAAALGLAALPLGIAAAPAPVTPVAAPTAGLIAARAASPVEFAGLAHALNGYEWFSLDMHLHTDHSSDAGLPHQEFDTPASHDTFLDDQRDQAIRMGMDAVAFTDHRTFDQHFDPEYSTEFAQLITAEEWGGGRHATAFGIIEKLEHGNGTDCGLAQAALEAAAQGGMLGIAHPKDGLGGSCLPDVTSMNEWPLSHVESVRGGDGPVQHLGAAEANGSNTEWYMEALAAGVRIASVNGSDNHFKQVWAGPSGPGGSATYVLVRDASEAGFIEAVRARRTMGGWSEANAKIVTLLDADQDGTFDALTGDYAIPTGDTVTLALDIELGQAGWVQVINDAGAVVAEEPVVLPQQQLLFDLPSTSDYYFATYGYEQVTRVGLPDPLDYVDLINGVSSPVWLSAPAPTMATRPTMMDGSQADARSAADWSGFSDVASVGKTVHMVWQERRVADNAVIYARSEDGGKTFGTAVPLSKTRDARLPAITAVGERVTIAWEDHKASGLGGHLVSVTSMDAGETFTRPETLVAAPTWKADLDSTSSADHLVWLQQAADGVWSVMHRAYTASGWGPTVRVSSAMAWDGPLTEWAVPPRVLKWVPAALDPVVVADGETVAIAWHDNREDPTPLRSASPDDWGIWSTVSHDGGATFSDDLRVSPRVLRKDDPSKAEGVEGNPARNADLAVLADGTMVLAYQDPQLSGIDGILVQRSTDGGLTWSTPAPVVAPDSSYRYQPTLQVSKNGKSVTVVWQQGLDPEWAIASATSSDGGVTWSAAEVLTDGGRYAGWPSLAEGILSFTAETPTGFAVHTALL